MATTQKAPTKIVVPEKVTIAGVEYSWKDVPELKTLIETAQAEAAQTEKIKLHSMAESLREQIEALQKPADPQIKVDFPTDVLNEKLADFKREMMEQLAPLAKYAVDSSKSALEGYRGTLIKDNPECFPELVVGNSKEDLDAALVKSKQLYATHVKPIKQAAEPPITAAVEATATPGLNTPTVTKPVVPVPKVEQPVVNAELKNIKNLDEKTFEQKKEGLLNSLKENFASLIGT
jgi:hypothetical protein